MDTYKQRDPFEFLPPELVQMIFNDLPISNMWRFRAVSKRWHGALSGIDSLRTIARRWSTHSSEQRASNEAYPSTTAEQDARRAQSFLSGRPIAIATLLVGFKAGRFPGHAQLQGKWLAYNTIRQAGNPLHLELWDLTTGRKREFTTELSDNMDFILTTDLLAYTVSDPAHGEQKWEGKPLHNVLNTISLKDFSIQQTALFHGTAMQQGMQMGGHKQYTVIVRHRGNPPYNELVEIFDRESGNSWSFDWRAPTFGGGISFTFTIDADRQVLTFWVADTKSGRTNVDDVVVRSFMSLQEYSFNGERIRTLDRDILLDGRDHREMDIFGPWIMSLTPAGSPGLWSTCTCFWGKDESNTVLQLDWNSSSTTVDAYYRLETPAIVWKDTVFHHGQKGELLISRNSSRASIDAKPVSRCVLHSRSSDSSNLAGIDKVPEFRGVNESYLITEYMTAKNCRAIRIYAFDELAVQAIHQEETSAVPGDIDHTLLHWEDAKDIFVQDGGPSIVHRTVTEGRLRRTRDILHGCA